MKLGIVIYSNDPETVWNGFRLGIFSLKQNNQVKIFLSAKGVEAEELPADKFDVPDLMNEFVKNGGEILACATAFKVRGSMGTKLCPMSSMADLYGLIEESDKLISI
ncbi:MAG: DsrE family protein [Flavobacteriales bacterium]|nr:DsrE family protein [Flavobacteriales bacterium]